MELPSGELAELPADIPVQTEEHLQHQYFIAHRVSENLDMFVSNFINRNYGNFPVKSVFILGILHF